MADTIRTEKSQFELILEDNPLAMGMMFLPHHFRGPTPPFHIEILNQCLKNRYLAVAAPRESAKSTILAFLYPLHCILFRKKHFILIVSNTYKKAAGSLDSIKKEITDNQMIKAFGIKVTRDAEGDSIFTHANGMEIRVLCKGSEQIGSVRGEKFGAYRPDLIVVDDLEDDELVKNPQRRLELMELYDQALVPAGDKETCNFVVIGTILHDDSLMSKLVSTTYYPEYKKMIYRALRKTKSGELNSLWAYKWTVDDLLKMSKERPGVFAKEYQNNPVSGLMQKFFKEDFRYWKIENMQYICFGKAGEIISKGSLYDCKAAIACDLAWEEGRQNDFSVILPAFLTPTNDILVDDYTCKKGLRPAEIEEEIFTRVTRLKSITGGDVPVGFEKAKLEKVIKFLLGQAMRRRNQWITFKDILWDKDKIGRIETVLQPRFSQHSLYHKQGMGDLEAQALRFPSGAHDDILDALHGVCKLLEYPKKMKKTQTMDSEFDRVRQMTIDVKKAKPTQFIFGGKKSSPRIPYTTDYK